MDNALITGSRGFLGTALKSKLVSLSNVDLLEFNRENVESELVSVLEKADIIFHLAGEVRPQSQDSEFERSNAELTEKICTILERMTKRTPIIFASTVHAKLPKNAYGSSKLRAEERLRIYSERTRALVNIYRLPHMFGPGCKPHYNSVISTWMYELSHGQEINVFDRSIQMTYVYSLDLMDDWIKCLDEQSIDLFKFISPTISYDTTLGEIEDVLRKFADQGEPAHHSSFEKKLYETYITYLLQNV
ncbi:NAD-dependent epimerase/dehydratase family protein [Shewanella sp.]|uniref:NAD-dependent epimerase/dehydratase family protein n=1 Tax=Shewanella sp. TaxID=50422 RepID=UPI0040549C61